MVLPFFKPSTNDNVGRPTIDVCPIQFAYYIGKLMYLECAIYLKT